MCAVCCMSSEVCSLNMVKDDGSIHDYLPKRALVLWSMSAFVKSSSENGLAIKMHFGPPNHNKETGSLC